MWQSIPRTGSLLLRASRPHSIQRFTSCLLSSLHASFPASSGLPAVPLSPRPRVTTTKAQQNLLTT